MVQHIVMWKFKEESTQDDILEIKNRLEALPEIIPQIKFYEVGLNVKDSNNAMDMVLISKFKSIDEMAIYANHVEHQRVVELIGNATKEARVVDFTSVV
jgi:hypothetical protein